MPDNIDITPGSGATVAADEIGGVKYQRVKPCVGDDGVAVDVSQNNPLPVQITDVMIALLAAIERLNTPIWIDPATGRLRISMDAIAGGVNLSGVTAVAGITNIGGMAANSLILDTMMSNYANTVRPRIT